MSTRLGCGTALRLLARVVLQRPVSGWICQAATQGHYTSKSDEYASDDTVFKNIYSLLLCRVALGELLKMTSGGDTTHSMIGEAIKSNMYESVMGDREAAVGTYREFVVYDKAQAYPEYIIHYKRLASV